MRLDYETDKGAGARARLGLILLHVDETIETEFGRFTAADGVAVHCTRVRSGEELNEESLNTMAARIPASARLLPPETPMDVVGFACTSGATVIGPDNVARSIREARPADSPGTFGDTAVTDPLTAVKAACRHMGIRRLGFVTPYVASVSAAMRDLLEADGLSISAFGSFEQSQERLVARITPESVLAAVTRVGGAADCDGVFVSCTNVRTLGVLEAAEQALGVPVISSTQALAWHMLRLAGVDDPVPGAGSLLRS